MASTADRDQDPPLTQDDNDHEEERGLLNGDQVHRKKTNRWTFIKDCGLYTWAIVATLLVAFLAVSYARLLQDTQEPAVPKGKRNLIFMVSDGMGPTSLALTRSYKQFSENLPWGSQLGLEKYLIGQSRTRSTSSLVTDSAAGATAFSCGMKSYNGAISVLDDKTPCGTVLEAAKKAGYMTGLVVTTRITDATPAVFASHVHIRSEEDRIAEQFVGDYPLGRVVDLFMGGGRCHFLPNSTVESCRADEKDIVAIAKERGFTYGETRKDFDKLNGGSDIKLPYLGLYASHDIPYEIDRRAESHIYPSLDEMAKVAMKALSEATKSSDKGFFLMIEGSRIDHAGHANDPAAQVFEVMAYDDAFKSVVDFLEHDSVQGVMVSTSDHETGGLAVARQIKEAYPEYLWYPEVLANVTNSASQVAAEYFRHREQAPTDDMSAYLLKLVQKRLGIFDAKKEEIAGAVAAPDLAPYVFADMVSRRAQTGWSTHGHSGADVNIYTSDRHAASALIGNHENTEVGQFLRDYLEVDVAAITQELKDKGHEWNKVNAAGEVESWLGPEPKNGERLDGQDHREHYHGEFKKHKMV